MEVFQDMLLAAVLNLAFVPWYQNWGSLGPSERYSVILAIAVLVSFTFLLVFLSVVYYRKFF